MYSQICANVFLLMLERYWSITLSSSETKVIAVYNTFFYEFAKENVKILWT